MSVNVLHIVIDDKFIDCAIDLFEDSSAVNTYVILDKHSPFKYIKKHSSKILEIGKNYFFDQIQINNFDIIAFHTLDRYLYDLVLQIPLSVKVLWLAWGYDIYEPFLGAPAIISLKLHRPYTRRVIKLLQKKSLLKWLKSSVKTMYMVLSGKKRLMRMHETILQNKVINRVDYMSTVLYSEYRLLCTLPHFKAEYFPFQYTDKVDKDKTDIWLTSNGYNILLGNSATFENNHLDVLIILKRRNIRNKCVMPISYGDDKYREYLRKKSKKYNNLIILDTFISKNEYESVLASCNVGVFGHIRQQALGNIIICIHFGMKLFFFEDSVVYKYLKEKEFIVYSIERDLTLQAINEPLTNEEKRLNIKKIDEIFDYSNVLLRLNNKLNMISNEHDNFE